jgi:hypothetical protein
MDVGGAGFVYKLSEETWETAGVGFQLLINNR